MLSIKIEVKGVDFAPIPCRQTMISK